MQFTPLKDFYDDDLRSQYCAGLTYTVRPGNDLLAVKVKGWLEAGKVALGGPTIPQARVAGEGTVN